MGAVDEGALLPRRAVIFGTGAFGEVVDAYLRHESDVEVVAFTAHAAVVDAQEFGARPLVPFEELPDRFPPDEFEMFVAVGYTKLNAIREQICAEARSAGYRLLSHVSPRAHVFPGVSFGDNCFVFEDNTIQPFVSVGDGVIMWSGNHVGHHSSIGDGCFISSHVVISGSVTIGRRCFIGVNATLRDAISIGDDNLIGAGAVILRSTKPGEAYLTERTKPAGRAATSFM